jgi:hypothetical protein
MQVPTIELYRGISIFDFQPRDRVENVVKPEIDQVLALDDPDELFRFARDAAHAPEARLAARDRWMAIADLHIAAHEARIAGDPVRLDAAVAGLDDLHWHDPDRFASLLDAARSGVALRRPADQRDRLLAALGEPLNER